MYKALKNGDRHASVRWLAMTYLQPVWGPVWASAPARPKPQDFVCHTLTAEENSANIVDNGFPKRILHNTERIKPI